MDIRYLKYFISVAKHLNFTKAAQECFISQTAMSQHISKMEEEIGFKLFERNNRMVQLTPGGQVFLEEAVTLARKYERAIFWGSVASMDYRGCLRIGFLSYTERRFLPQLIRAFNQRNPNVEIMLMRGNLTQLTDCLRNEELDIIMAYNYDIEGMPDIQIKSFPFDDLLFVVNRDHPLAKEKTVTAEMFKDEPFLFVNEAMFPKMYERCLKLCAAMGFTPKIAGAPQDMDALFLMLEVGLGVTFLPSCIKDTLDKDLVYLEIENMEFGPVESSLAWMTNNPNPSLDIFLKITEEMVKEDGTLL